MKIISGIFTGILQLIAGYFFLFLGAWVGLGSLLNNLGLVSPENSNPWWNTPLTFFTFVLAASFGVWLVGWLASKMRPTEFNKKKVWWRTFGGSALGILIVSILHLFLGAVGMLPILAAVVGAMIGYYLKPKAEN
jgi:MFS family permease